MLLSFAVLGAPHVGLFARRGRGQIEHRLTDGHGFHLFKAHVREPRLAGVLRAVSAQPRHNRDFLLPLAGSAIQGQRLPPAVCVVQVAARAVNAGRRTRSRPSSPRPQPSAITRAVSLYGRVLANGNRLLKARVVGRGVFHQRGGRAILQRHRLQIRSARARHPCAGLQPSGSPSVVKAKSPLAIRLPVCGASSFPPDPCSAKKTAAAASSVSRTTIQHFLTFFHFNPPGKIKT